MRLRPELGSAAAFLASVLAANAVAARVVEVEPGEDYRPHVSALQPGDELVFLPGVHERFAKLDIRGTSEAPIVIRGETGPDGGRAEIRWTQRGSNTWEVSGGHLRIDNLVFHSAHHYGLRVREGRDITIENCLFRDNGGGDLSANSGDVTGLHVLRSRFVGGKRTPVYIGSHDGGLRIIDFRFEGNVVDGSHIHHRGVVGYGIQLKLNVDGVIRNNYITGTQGPGIMVYGFSDPQSEHRQLVENNIVVGARNSANIVVGGGPAAIRNNLCLGGHSGGIAVIDYGGRDLLDGIALASNVAAGNDGKGLRVASDVRGFVATENRIWTAARDPGVGDLPEAASACDNDNVPIGAPLLAMIGQLRDVVPASAAVHAATQRFAADPPATQEALLTLLRPLVRQ